MRSWILPLCLMASVGCGNEQEYMLREVGSAYQENIPQPNPDTLTGCLCTPDDPDFKEYRYKSKIPYCQRNVSYELKQEIYADYGVAQGDQWAYTIDHFIPLSVGGCNRKENLWPEHRTIKQKRPEFETDLFKAVRAGHMTQEEAVDAVFKEKLGVDKAPSSENGFKE